MATTSSFIKRYDGKSNFTFNAFQNAMKREIKRLCGEINANLVSYNKGYMYMSGFVERDGHYVYFSYEDIENTKAILSSCNGAAGPFMIRTASGPKDFRGGINHFIPFIHFSEEVDKLLKEEHIPFGQRNMN